MTTNEERAERLSIRGALFTELTLRVPDYQRNYAWGEPEILQLVDDVTDAVVQQGQQYFVGNLVTARAPRPTCSWDVIDGQQRITTMYLLLLVLNHRWPEIYGEMPNPPVYQSRRRATHTLAWLAEHPVVENWGEDVDDHDAAILEGYRVLYQHLVPSAAADGLAVANVLGAQSAADFLLDNVFFVRIVLPEGTDLNRYFEVMNTRGAQLRQDEIVKARLMSRLAAEDQVTFGRIWDACADMERYVQTALIPADPTSRNAVRTQIFGRQWNWIATDDFDEIQQILGTSAPPHSTEAERSEHGLTLEEAILDSTPPDEVEDDAGTRQFRSAVGFSNFLLRAEHIVYRGAGAPESGVPHVSIDDKQLIEVFAERFPRETDPDEVKAFITSLLTLRVLFDQFILKRDLQAGDSDDGAWALQTIRKSQGGQDRGHSDYYRGTFSAGSAQGAADSAEQARLQNRIRMLQSALRITYVSPRSMHWITEVLGHLWAKVSGHRHLGRMPPRTLVTAQEVLAVLEDYARAQVRPHLQGPCPLVGGLGIDRIVFTYLDYLLLVRDEKLTFRFPFRNSIEHFYPATIDEEAKARPDDVMTQQVKDKLGNLALVTVSENSTFGNYRPEHKAKMAQIVEQSPKLQLMARITNATGWDKGAIEAHHEEMLELLARDVSLPGEESVRADR